MDRTAINITPSAGALSAIACTSDVPADENHPALLKAFQSFAGQTKHTLLSAYEPGEVNYIPSSPRCRMERFRVRTAAGSDVCIVGVRASSGLVQYQFNASGFGPEERDSFDVLLQLTLRDGYRSLYEHGTLSIAEYAVDVDGLALADAAIVDRGMRSYTRIPEGTIYCGVRASPIVAVLYDKGALRRKADPSFTLQQLRFELRRRARTTTLRDWVEQASANENPWAQFIVLPREALAAVVGKKRAEKIRALGVRSDVKNPAALKKLFAELEGARYAWAEPQTLRDVFRSKLIATMRPPAGM